MKLLVMHYVNALHIGRYQHTGTVLQTLNVPSTGSISLLACPTVVCSTLKFL